MKLLKLLVIGALLGVGASLLAKYYLIGKYEIDEVVTHSSFEEIYGSLILEIESLYDIDDENTLKLEIERIRKQIPIDLGILEITQRDKGVKHQSYGVKYFGYWPETYTHNYFYYDSSMRYVPNLIRGYVETETGKKIDAVSYTKKVKVGEENLEIRLIVSYDSLLELTNAL